MARASRSPGGGGKAGAAGKGSKAAVTPQWVSAVRLLLGVEQAAMQLLSFVLLPGAPRLRFNPLRLVFMTTQVNDALAVYLLAAAVAGLLCRRSAALQRVRCAVGGSVALLALFIGMAYYALIHGAPETQRLAASSTAAYVALHWLHAGPLLIGAVELLLLAREGVAFSAWRAGTHVSVYAAFYCAWSVFAAWMNDGVWPYPFQGQLTLLGHATYYLSLTAAMWLAAYALQPLQRRLLVDGGKAHAE